MSTLPASRMQLPLVANETVSPEDAVAEMSKSASPYVLSASGAKSIVCGAWLIVNVLGTSGGASWFGPPPCEGVIGHEPAPVMLTFEPMKTQLPSAATET